jgi:DNA-binding PadR family transcriptional regulator
MRSSSTGFDLWDAVDGLRDAVLNRGGDRPSPRVGRGDIRTAVLVALLDEPMHGYQLIQAIEARSGGTWKPSPGSIYPTLQLLADEGLVTAEQVGERKVHSLTPAGRTAAETAAEGALPWEPRTLRDDAERDLALPKAGAKLAQAAAQVARHGSRAQSERTIEVLDEARRRIYAILAED